MRLGFKGRAYGLAANELRRGELQELVNDLQELAVLQERAEPQLLCRTLAEDN